ncbi:hypothetical protein B0T26DRAFT_872769 [Lasiosphaeria miniovina]|uniref:Uncharacterized protein n=1 Tax=Lasiosphaeria miniovina TaxID=1954250 RepID=A0AA40AMS1_9PEZI|nr:uncharacterized protein B0T26DRAFT_872769 [Lasiosphaeria miniovina]KAK0718635.1 hypothetical protein B0T26DRAFT_872769 [Lasiosphaeria miniovina]
MKTRQAISVFCLAAAQVSGVLAVPEVTVVPLGSKTCVSWPSWISQRGADVTGSFAFQVDQADDAGVNGLLTSSVEFNWTDISGTHITVDLRKSTSFAKPYYRCIDGSVHYLSRDTIISVAKDRRNAFLTFSAGYKLEPYAHEVAGVRQDGVFLGALNQTTWGFHYVYSSKCGQIDYYEVKLQGLPDDPDTEPRAGYDPQFLGFMKAVSS